MTIRTEMSARLIALQKCETFRSSFVRPFTNYSIILLSDIPSTVTKQAPHPHGKLENMEMVQEQVRLDTPILSIPFTRSNLVSCPSGRPVRFSFRSCSVPVPFPLHSRSAPIPFQNPFLFCSHSDSAILFPFLLRSLPVSVPFPFPFLFPTILSRSCFFPVPVLLSFLFHLVPFP